MYTDAAIRGRIPRAARSINVPYEERERDHNALGSRHGGDFAWLPRDREITTCMLEPTRTKSNFLF